MEILPAIYYCMDKCNISLTFLFNKINNSGQEHGRVDKLFNSCFRSSCLGDSNHTSCISNQRKKTATDFAKRKSFELALCQEIASVI